MRRQYYRRGFVAGIMALVLAVMPVMIAQAGLRFDGRYDGFVVKSVTHGLNAISVMMWVKGEYKAGALLHGPVIFRFSPHFGVYLLGRNLEGSGYLDWDEYLPTSSRWRHLAVVWSSPAAGDGKMKLYIDGIKQGNDLTYSGGTNGVLRGGELRFCPVKDNIGVFKGTLEDVRIYRRALTDEEVLAVYREEGADGVTNGLAAWFPMKDGKTELTTEGDARLLKDRSGNGNHGKITGTPAWKTVDNDEAAQKRREQIKLTCEYLGGIRAECGQERQSLGNWFENHPEGDKKWRARFEELNRGFGWTPDALCGYDDLCAEIGLQEIFPESGKDRK